MMAVELEACHVHEEPAFPAPVEGYMVSFMAYYEWGFDTLLALIKHRIHAPTC
jgi:hypothetical protein